MALLEFNPENTVSARTKKAAISINGKTGRIFFNAAALELAHIEGGVIFFQDEDDIINWYVAPKATGFELSQKEGESGKQFVNKRLASMILECLEVATPTAAIALGTDPLDVEGSGLAYPLINIPKGRK